MAARCGVFHWASSSRDSFQGGAARRARSCARSSGRPSAAGWRSACWPNRPTHGSSKIHSRRQVRRSASGGGSVRVRPIVVGLLLVLAATAETGPRLAAEGQDASAPLGLDRYLPAPADKPSTTEKLALGRRLFVERRLSADGRTSCASCHQPERAFTDGRRVARGVFGRPGRRNVPSILNRGYGAVFGWDGRADTLEDQVMRAMSSPMDLGLSPGAAAERLSRDVTYSAAFDAAYAAPLSADRLVQAIATFVRIARSGNSAFDRFVAVDPTAISPEARRG